VLFAKVEGSKVWVRVKTSTIFQRGETVSLGDQPGLTSVTISTNPSQVFVEIDDAATIVARNPSNILQTYDNIITGKSVIWNNKTQQLTLRVDNQPIDNDLLWKNY